MEIEDIKTNPSEMKNILQEINSRVEEAEHQISEMENKKAEDTQSQQQPKQKE